MIDILNEQNFLENKNGRITEEQLNALKDKANIWAELYFWMGFIGFIAIIAKLEANLSWLLPLYAVLSVAMIWCVIRSSVLVRYYLLVLPDVRNNNFSHALVRLGYHNGYVLQTDDGNISLHCHKEDGFLSGNTYEVFFLTRTKVVLSANLKQRVSDLEQAHGTTNILGKAIGFTESDLVANRNGQFSFLHKLNFLNKNRLTVLLAVILLFLCTWLGFIILNGIYSTTIFLVALLIMLTAGLISWSIHILFVVMEGNVESAEGVGFIKSRIVREGRATYTQHYFVIPHQISLRIPKRIFKVMLDGFFYRIFFTPRTKYLVSVEVLKLPGKNNVIHKIQ